MTPTIVGATPTTTATTTTTTTAARIATTPLAPDTADLCALKRIDGALIMNRRLYVAHKCNVWPIDMRERRYGAPSSFTDYFKFLPRNLTRISAMYQRPLGDIAIFAGDYVYLADSNFHLKAGWPRSVEYVGFPCDSRINSAINTHAGRSYVIYNDDKIAEINNCAMTATRHGAGYVFRDTICDNGGLPSRRRWNKNWLYKREINFAKHPIRILGRRYPLTKTAYKYVDIAVVVKRESQVDIVLGDCHGKKISLTPDMRKDLLTLRNDILSYFENDLDEAVACPPASIIVGTVTLRFGKINNLKTLRFEMQKSRTVISHRRVVDRHIRDRRRQVIAFPTLKKGFSNKH
ncbi:hypothetical protein EAG_07451 [Camponotus floridanus]|uniref:Uncharacterized protein n=1 Tax=Camponotus floridanus TaxID=104421 RepID=E2ACJ6_CAMFO|nr:hypothetical protein EAG_07451 [Camponotus floridanus]